MKNEGEQNRTATNRFCRKWTAKFSIIDGRVIGALYYDGIYQRKFNVNVSDPIAVAVGSSGHKLNFRLRGETNVRD